MRRLHTRVVRVDPASPDTPALREAARALAAGCLVAFPTETVYGLGADAFNEAAVRRIFEVKGRPPDNPLIVHVALPEEAMRVARPDAGGLWEALARRFWPGPLTLVLPYRPGLPAATRAGLETVAVRVPAHPVAQALIRAAGCPVAAPSANRSGRPSPSTAQHVLDDLEGRVEWLIDAGPADVGVESTVLDLTADPPVVWRPGGVTLEALRGVLGRVEAEPGQAAAGPPPPSPGLKYRHYAPRAPLVLLEGSPRAVAAEIRRRLAEPGRGRVGLLVTEETLEALEQAYQGGSLPGRAAPFCVGRRREPETVARSLFEGLRTLDRLQPCVILAEAVEPSGLGLAVDNRLRKAAAGQVVHCAEPP